MYVYTQTYMYVCIYVHITNTLVSKPVFRMPGEERRAAPRRALCYLKTTRICIYIYVYMCMYMHMYVYVCIYMYAYIYIYMHMCVTLYVYPIPVKFERRGRSCNFFWGLGPTIS